MATTELFKKVLYTGVGVVTNTTDRVTDRVKKSMEDITKVGDDAEVEGKKIVESFVEDVKHRGGDVNVRFKKIIDTVLGQFDLPNRTEAEKLNAKIAELEEKIVANKRVAKRVTKAKQVVKK